MFIAALFTVTEIWDQPKCPSADEWIKQLWDSYTIEYYSAIKNEESLALCKNIMLSEISQSEKDKYHMMSLMSAI